MSPRFVDREEKTRTIARAALELFSQRGFAATSVGQIAKAAGIGKGTIYEYFDTKADIFVAAVLEWMQHIEKNMRKKLDQIEDPVQRLYEFAHMNMELVDPIDPATARLSVDVLQHTLLQDGALFTRRHLIKEVHTGLRQIVVSILLDGISKGVFRPAIARDAEKIAINLLGYLDGISLHYLMSENYFDIHEQMDFSLEGIIRMISIQPASKGDPALKPSASGSFT
jgi:AcrR family transcriptional regulator